MPIFQKQFINKPLNVERGLVNIHSLTHSLASVSFQRIQSRLHPQAKA